MTKEQKEANQEEILKMYEGFADEVEFTAKSLQVKNQALRLALGMSSTLELTGEIHDVFMVAIKYHSFFKDLLDFNPHLLNIVDLPDRLKNGYAEILRKWSRILKAHNVDPDKDNVLNASYNASFNEFVRGKNV